MNSTIRNREIVILHERNTDFIAVWDRTRDGDDKFGIWLLKELTTIQEYCKNFAITPQVKITLSIASQAAVDAVEVDEFLKHAEHARPKG